MTCFVAAGLAAVLGAVLSLVPTAPAAAELPAGASAIVFVSDRDSLAAETPVDDVYLIAPPNRWAYQMTDDGDGAERFPTLSPDGRWLAYVRFYVKDNAIVPEATALFRCRVHHVRSRFSCDAEQRIVGPISIQSIAWTPDGRSLVYSGVPTEDGDVDLYRVSARGGQPTNLTVEPDDDVVVMNTQPSVSRDGLWMYYTQGVAGGVTGADLYRRHLDGSGRQQLTSAAFNDAGVDVSPDGRWLVFHSNRDGSSSSGFDIYTMKAAVEGSDNPAVNLTHGLGGPVGQASEERRPSWSPDGRQIAFHWYTDPVGGFCAGCNDGEIYTMSADGSRVRNLTANNPVDGEEASTPQYGDITPDWGVIRRPR